MIARMQAWADRAAGANAGMGGDMRGDASVARTTQSARMPLWTDGDIGHAHDRRIDQSAHIARDEPERGADDSSD